jgi:hypothetical protein
VTGLLRLDRMLPVSIGATGRPGPATALALILLRPDAGSSI